jgi:GDP-D-mannose dehydratase
LFKRTALKLRNLLKRERKKFEDNWDSMWKASTMGDEKNGEVTPYNRTEAYAEAGHYGATVVSPGFKSSYGTFTCNGI